MPMRYHFLLEHIQTEKYSLNILEWLLIGEELGIGKQDKR